MSDLARIVKLTTPSAGRSLVEFSDGREVLIEWKQFAQPDTTLEVLADPEYATECKIVEWGYGLRWPNGMDWSSGAVLAAGRPVGPARKTNIRPVSALKAKVKSRESVLPRK